MTGEKPSLADCQIGIGRFSRRAEWEAVVADNSHACESAAKCLEVGLRLLVVSRASSLEKHAGCSMEAEDTWSSRKLLLTLR